MTVLTRSARSRRVGRRPGWLLLTVLLVLAILASSALVFTNRVELLKLGVILALWAAVVAAFVSVIYRRQSDTEQAKSRDLKMVYDLQLDREISARREYELTLEAQLRRELTAELRAEAADEVSVLRAELAALRANLEILFDTDLGHRPAIETERTTVGTYGDWAGGRETAGRVMSSRLDTEHRDDVDANTEESPIIDVSAEPHPPESEWAPPAGFGGSHRGPSEAQEPRDRRHVAEEPQRTSAPQPPQPPLIEQPEPVAYSQPEPQIPGHAPPRPPAPEPPQSPEPERVSGHVPRTEWQPAPEPPQSPEPERVSGHVPRTEWQPAPARGEWIPAGAPGSNWVSPVTENGSSAEYVGRRRAHELTMSTPPVEAPHGRHSAPPSAVDPGRPSTTPPPALATESAQPPPAPAPPVETARARHRSIDDTEYAESQHTGGHSVAELLARLQATSSGSGGRRRRAE